VKISALPILPSDTGKNNSMDAREKYTGFAIALAWPQTFCKQPGSWYDPLALRLGLNRNHYYRVGHAAVVLVDAKKKKCHYFDFGRYHAPFQHGRVRSAETDHELLMRISPILSADRSTLLNFPEILAELQANKACHGEGDIYASYSPVNFQSAYEKATHMQQTSPIPYGPFRIPGSNCSRFVNTVIRAGKPAWKLRFRLKYQVWFTPTPMNNVNSLDHQMKLAVQFDYIPFYPIRKLDHESLISTLQAPSKHPGIPENAQWLSGEGAGSWFDFKFADSGLRVTRYSPDGIIECAGHFKISNGKGIRPDNSFRITYPSNCMVISLAGHNRFLQFKRA
jgi:hypothetical protein